MTEKANLFIVRTAIPPVEHTHQGIEYKRNRSQGYKQPRQIPFFGPALGRISERAFCDL